MCVEAIVLMLRIDYKFMDSSLMLRPMIKKPVVPCRDFAGEVVAFGGMVDSLQIGQPVYGCQDMGRVIRGHAGVLSEYTIVHADRCMPLPKNHLDYEGAAALATVANTMCAGISEGKLSRGSRLFINGGSGGCGTVGIQIAKAWGLHVEVSCSTRNIGLCEELGADVVHDYTAVNLPEYLASTYRTKNFDMIFDCVGSDEMYQQCHEFLKPEGLYLSIAAEINPTSLLGVAKKSFMPGWLGGGRRRFVFHNSTDDVAMLPLVNELVMEAKLRPVIDEVFEWDRAVSAFEKLGTFRARGKIVVTGV